MSEDKATRSRPKGSAQIRAEEIRHVAVAPCSVEFSRDAKGAPRWTIKVYGELENMEDVVDRLKEIDDILDEKFPGRAGA